MQVDRFASIPGAFFDAVERLADTAVYAAPRTDHLNSSSGVDGETLDRPTFREVARRVVIVAEELRRIGLGKGDAVAILSNTRPEWMECDLAILSIGGISVSIYQSLPAADIGYILFDSGAKTVFAENEEQVQKLLSLIEHDCAIPSTEDRAACTARLEIQRIFVFESATEHPLVTPLSSLFRAEANIDTFQCASIEASDLAALVYTSGTTGPPKGVMQTHKNHLANVRQAFQCGLVSEGMSIMLFLPLAHSFAKLMGYIGFLSGVELRFSSITDKRTSKANPVAILDDIRSMNADLVPVVPRFLEKMRDGIQLKSLDKSAKGYILRLALWSAISTYRARLNNRRALLTARILSTLTSAVRKKVREQLFGDNFKRAISGGAKLPTEVAYFFDALGIEVSEGYGLTETCVATNVNRGGQNRIGTVGPLLSPDIELKFTEDGEILFRGPNVTRGYLNRPSATKAAWDEEGWFHTGDLGSLDQDGYLSIVGRKKEIIVTSGGKKISPHTIEEQLKTVRGVSQAILVGDGKPYCVAVLTLDPAGLPSTLSKNMENPHSLSGLAVLSKSQAVREYLHQEVAKINSKLSSFETVKNFLLLPEELTVENGLLTPSFKVKRGAVEKKYQKEIAELFVKTQKP